MVSACGSGHSAAPAATSTLVVVHGPRYQPISASLSGGIRLRGSIYPDLPQVTNVPYKFNTIRLTLTDPSNHQLLPAKLALTATMLDMTMSPVVVFAKPHSTEMVARIVLPMFGTYRLAVSGHSGRNVVSGHFDVPVSII